MSLGLAVIGLGARGYKTVRDAVDIPEIGLTVGCEPIPDRAQRARDDFGIDVESDWAPVVDRSDIHLVYVATPNDRHDEVACAAMNAGKAVLLQKPMAHSIDACRRIMRVQEETGAFLQIGFECRYSLLYSKAKELVDSGQVGGIRNFQMNYFSSLWHVWLEHPEGWKWLAERSGGLIAEKLSHYIDLFQWYTGSLVNEVDVFAADPVLSYFKTTDTVHVGMRTENAATGVITFSFCRASTAAEDQSEGMDGAGTGYYFDHTLIGEKGSLHLHDARVLDLFLYDCDGETRPYLERRHEFDEDRLKLVHNTHDELADVVRRVIDDEPPSLAPAVAFQVFEVCFAAEESQRRRGPVRLDEWRAAKLKPDQSS
ncbi:MAG: Gfo/Idh/MocA family oxidoreductase [Lentisphaeria bacterium]|jgi:predicted dehydrogenase|nr:Gfo/Idh/MocA family oxidoreductase [Lentisphaeria bacterium]MDP7740316.1 Gfo/Idh/MocA family oxidoreductase [Lentisphaeria bacterium]